MQTTYTPFRMTKNRKKKTATTTDLIFIFAFSCIIGAISHDTLRQRDYMCNAWIWCANNVFGYAIKYGFLLIPSVAVLNLIIDLNWIPSRSKSNNFQIKKKNIKRIKIYERLQNSYKVFFFFYFVFIVLKNNISTSVWRDHISHEFMQIFFLFVCLIKFFFSHKHIWQHMVKRTLHILLPLPTQNHWPNTVVR